MAIICEHAPPARPPITGVRCESSSHRPSLSIYSNGESKNYKQTWVVCGSYRVIAIVTNIFEEFWYRA